jgi:thiol-disulfide isomerase/thioredoxin
MVFQYTGILYVPWKVPQDDATGMFPTCAITSESSNLLETLFEPDLPQVALINGAGTEIINVNVTEELWNYGAAGFPYSAAKLKEIEDKRDAEKALFIKNLSGFGEFTVKSNGDKVSVAELAKKSKIALYFSAHWCPPCRRFTPKLAAHYLEKKYKNVDVIFISSDKSESEFKEYLSEMPWSALPYQERELKATLSKLFNVSGIPSLILIDPASGKVIDEDACDSIFELEDQ